MYTKAPHQEYREDSSTSYLGDSPGLNERLTGPDVNLGYRVCLSNLSFGAAKGYRDRGGQAVISDFSSASTPVDLTTEGLAIPRDLGRGGFATGAFVIGSRSLRIVADLSIDSESPCSVLMRARFGDEIRVQERSVEFENGQARLECPVVGIVTNSVGTVDEDWTWEYRVGGEGFESIHCEYLDASVSRFPIRLFFTAAAPINSCPRESFYHIACAIDGAMSVAAVERDIWTYFIGFQNGRYVTNARGKRLGFWRDQKPGSEKTAFVNRNAQDLVTLTDSSCRGWAELLREVFAIHGIESTVRAIQPKLSYVHPRLGLPTFSIPNGAGGMHIARTVGILVKPFKWSAPSEVAPFPFTRDECVVNAGKFTWKLDNIADSGTAQWPKADALDLLRPGHTSRQEAGKVRGIFGNHAVVLVKHGTTESWYDPSFGFGPHPSLLHYENDLLGKGEENPGGLFAIVGWKREVQIDEVTGQPREINAGLLLGATPPPPGPMLEAVEPG